MYIGYIYKITNKTNGKSYIGKTTNLNKRFAQHCSGRGCTKALNRAIKKYGKDNFTFECLESVAKNTLEELNLFLNNRECYYIKEYNTFITGYNCTLGGEGLSGAHPSKETKTKISKALKGHIESIETRQKKSVSRLGKKMSDASREKCREAFRNRSIESENYRKQRIRETIKGKQRDKNIVDKIAIKHKKAVLQFDLKGNFIKEYDSVTSIQVSNPSNISSCCKGKSKTAYGYIWAYKVRKEENNG